MHDSRLTSRFTTAWELSLRAWASPRLAFGLRSEANWDLQTKAVCDLLL